MHFFEIPAFGIYLEKIRDVEDRLDKLNIKLEPRLESKVRENIKKWRKEEKEGGKSDFYGYEIKIFSWLFVYTSK